MWLWRRSGDKEKNLLFYAIQNFQQMLIRGRSKVVSNLCRIQKRSGIFCSYLPPPSSFFFSLLRFKVVRVWEEKFLIDFFLAAVTAAAVSFKGLRKKTFLFYIFLPKGKSHRHLVRRLKNYSTQKNACDRGWLEAKERRNNKIE